MTITIKSAGGGKSTLAFEHTDKTAKIKDTAEDAARKVYEKYPVYLDEEFTEIKPFDDLSDQEQLDLLDRFIIEDLNSRAGTYHIQSSVKASRKAARDEVKGKYLE